MQVLRIDVTLLGKRGYPEGFAKIPEEQCQEFGALLDAAREKNPAATAEEVVRSIWRYGTRQTARNLKAGVPLTPSSAIPTFNVS